VILHREEKTAHYSLLTKEYANRQ